MPNTTVITKLLKLEEDKPNPDFALMEKLVDLKRDIQEQTSFLSVITEQILQAKILYEQGFPAEKIIEWLDTTRKSMQFRQEIKRFQDKENNSKDKANMHYKNVSLEVVDFLKPEPKGLPTRRGV